MNPRILTIAVIFALAAVPLCAQSGQIGGPVIGYVFDGSARSLRPVLGIPGASTLGDGIAVGFEPSNAFVAPRQDSAIALDVNSAVHLLRISSGAAVEIRCAACPSRADAAVFSPSGTAVALYSAGLAQIITGLPDSPAAGASFEVGVLPRATRGRTPPPPMALSDDGAWLLASTRVSVELFHANGGSRRLMDAKPYALVAFGSGSHDAAVADPGGAGLILFHDVAGTSSQQQLVASDSIRRPGALAFSADGSRLFLATPADRSVTSIDVISGGQSVAACDCAPSGLVSMGKTMRLNELGEGPLWLLDASTAQARVVFVPAAVPAPPQ